ncbi:hypothetical protein RB195_013319 [Necator americanus]|uniref:Tc1-like transposase DDE domain-containing protein n=1 Tax=Necator americanus TaxID=51031 RepID=A0ABR1DUZ6_NECAM
MLAINESFYDCVFTDECTVQIDCSTQYSYARDGDPYSRLRNRKKHPGKVHVWGGISCRGYARLVQDNAPAHTSSYTRQKFQEWNIQLLNWPAESPDLNPIELVWGNMKSYIRRRGVRTISELKSSILAYWEKLTPETCEKYAAGIKRRLRRVIKRNGGNILEGRQTESDFETDNLE